jgi:hypothetical protein
MGANWNILKYLLFQLNYLKLPQNDIFIQTPLTNMRTRLNLWVRCDSFIPTVTIHNIPLFVMSHFTSVKINTSVTITMYKNLISNRFLTTFNHCIHQTVSYSYEIARI